MRRIRFFSVKLDTHNTHIYGLRTCAYRFDVHMLINDNAGLDAKNRIRTFTHICQCAYFLGVFFSPNVRIVSNVIKSLCAKMPIRTIITPYGGICGRLAAATAYPAFGVGAVA